VKTVSTPSLETGLLAVARSGARHAWAVGGAAKNVEIVPVVESWNGSAWSRVAVPAPAVLALGAGAYLDAAAAAGPSNLWAFSAGGGWLNDADGTWTAGRLPFSDSRGTNIGASLVVGNTVWAFGGGITSDGTTPYAAYRSATGSWTQTFVVNRFDTAITAASALSGGDIWAVLGSSVLSPEYNGGLVHWYGGRWHTVSLPAQIRNASLGAILARSDKNVWVGGAVQNSQKGTTEAVAHWNGHRWAVVKLHAAPSALPFRIVSMAGDGAGGIWAVGLCSVLGNGGFRACPGIVGGASRLWHETAGRWSGPVLPKLAKMPYALASLALAGHSVWAVGRVKSGTSANGLIALWGPTPH
jgi:hypothetical protein